LKYYNKKYSPSYEEISNILKWMKRNKIPITFKTASEVTRYALDKKKKPNLTNLILY